MSFFRVLLILFLSVPLLEIYLLLKIGSSIGVFSTVILVVLTAVIGVWLLRLQGFATLARAQASIARGELPATTMLEGLMLFVAGALLLTPGFFTDTVGFLLLIPITRQWIIAYLINHGVMRSFESGNRFQSGKSSNRSDSSDNVIEGDFISHDDK
ncbi:FxsA family protein [Beggiatoa alba]|nr:FxsA family protein [Beggiatoa alba]